MTSDEGLGAGGLVGEAAVPQCLGVLQQLVILAATWSLPTHTAQGFQGHRNPLTPFLGTSQALYSSQHVSTAAAASVSIPLFELAADS